jgi:ubiquinone/menaquinone biosynthesis C-methylase UbiE
MKMTNRGNRFIYRLWAPVYDATVNHLFIPGRMRAMDLLGLQPGESVLLVGVGTGADLPLLPPGVRAVGVDLSPEMLAKARSKLPLPNREVDLIQGDAQNLLVEEAAYDAAILNLILSVIPDPIACLQAALRALKPTGRVVIFDKLLPDNKKPSAVRRLVNLFSTLFGTDVTRRMGDILAGSGWQVANDEASILHGTYRVILLKREV